MDISRAVNRCLKTIGRGRLLNFDFFSLACDESMDVSDTAQLLIF